MITPLAWPVVTAPVPECDDNRSNASPPGRSWYGSTGSPSCASWMSRRRFDRLASASFSIAIVSSDAGRLRVRRQEKHFADSVSAGRSQLHSQPRLVHAIHGPLLRATPSGVSSTIASSTGWNPMSAPQATHDSDWIAAAWRHLGHRKSCTRAR